MPLETIQRLGADRLVGRPDEQAFEGKAVHQLGLGIAQHVRHPLVGIGEAQRLVHHVNAGHRIGRQAVEHGLGVGQRRVLLFDVLQQLLDMGGGIIQGPAELAELVAGRH